MFTHPQFDPVAISLGPLSIHWYGLMYIVAFTGIWRLALYRARRDRNSFSDEQISDLVFYGAMGAVIGGRLGSVFFYNFDRFLADPVWLFKVWEGGMAFHGGLLGVLAVFAWYSRKLKRPFFSTMDFVAPLVPFGLGAGRLGNFIGGELWGRPTDLPWGMVFPYVDALPRHPSQLYQFALEGVAMLSILWWFSSKPRPRCSVTGLFGVCYGVFRFAVEFARQPDAGIGFIAFGWLTMGQLLSLPMIAVGAAMMMYGYRVHPVRN